MSLLGDMLDRAVPSRRSVPILLDGTLRARIEALETKLRAAQLPAEDKRLGTRPAVPASDELAALYDEAEAHTVKVVIQAMHGTDYRALIALHPPRKLEDGSVHPDDKAMNVNEETLRRPLVEACFAGVESLAGELVPATEAERDRLLNFCSDVQLDNLVEAAILVNRADDAVPLRRPPSLIPTSDGE